jgi:hypothetical protein
MEDVGIFYGNFVVIWYIFFPFWYVVKSLLGRWLVSQPLLGRNLQTNLHSGRVYLCTRGKL